MSLIRYQSNPWFDFPLDRFFEGLLTRPNGESTGNGTENGAVLPRVDINDGKNAVVLAAELPGVEKDDIKIELEDGILTLSAEKKSEYKDEKNGFSRAERVYGTYKRSFKVPSTINPEEISADYVDGVLKVTLPKTPEAAPKQITIGDGNGKTKQIEAQ